MNSTKTNLILENSSGFTYLNQKRKKFFDFITASENLSKLNSVTKALYISNKASEFSTKPETKTEAQNPSKRFMYNIKTKEYVLLNSTSLIDIERMIEDNLKSFMSSEDLKISEEFSKELQIILLMALRNNIDLSEMSANLVQQYHCQDKLEGINWISKVVTTVISKTLQNSIDDEENTLQLMNIATLTQNLGVIISDTFYYTKLRYVDKLLAFSEFTRNLEVLVENNILTPEKCTEEQFKIILIVFKIVFKDCSTIIKKNIFMLLHKYIHKTLVDLEFIFKGKKKYYRSIKKDELDEKFLRYDNNNLNVEFIYNTCVYGDTVTYSVEMGIEMTRHLINGNIIERVAPEKKKNSKINETSKVKIKNNKFVLLLQSKFPSLTPSKTDGDFMKYPHQDIGIDISNISNILKNNNDNIIGTFLEDNDKIYNEMLQNTPYRINLDFSYEFFKIIDEISNTSIENILANDYYLGALSEIYKYNFLNLRNNLNDSFQKLLPHIIKYSVDFNNQTKINLKEELRVHAIIKIGELEQHTQILKNISNLIYSQKLTLNIAITHNIILAAFDSFYYSWFVDTRGRFYIDAYPLSLQNTQLFRNMISFSATPPMLSELLHNSIETYQLDSKTKNLWAEQLYSMYKKPIEYILTLTKEQIITNPEIKLGDRFRFWILQEDYKNADLYGYPFNGFFSKDATCSGIQCTALLFKSYELAKYCGILDETLDIYELFANNRKIYLDELFNDNIFNITKELQNTLKDILENNIVALHKKEPYKKNKNKFRIIKNTLESLLSHEKKVFLAECEEKLLKNNVYDEFLEAILATKKYYPSTQKETKRITIIRIYFDKLLKILSLRQKFNKTKDKIVYEFCTSRNATKQNIMTTTYGSTNYGQTLQLLDAFKKYCFTHGFIAKSRDYSLLKLLSPMFNKQMHLWLKTNLPELTMLYDEIKDSCSFAKIGMGLEWICSYTFNLGHFMYILKPLKKGYFKYPLRLTEEKKPQYIGFRLINKNAKVNIRKYQSSVSANLIQAVDATIVYYSLANAIRQSVSMFTIHDSFHVPLKNATQLDPLIYETYLEVYDKISYDKILTREEFPYVNRKILLRKYKKLIREDFKGNKIIKH